MESFIADLIGKPKVPKRLRYAIVTIVCGLVIFLGVMLALKSPMALGRIFGAALSALFFAAAIYLFAKIKRNNRAEDEKN